MTISNIVDVKIEISNIVDVKIEIPTYPIYVGYNTPAEQLNASLEAKLHKLRAIAVVFLDGPIECVDDYSECLFSRICSPCYIGNLEGVREDIVNAIIRSNTPDCIKYDIRPLEELLHD